MVVVNILSKKKTLEFIKAEIKRQISELEKELSDLKIKVIDLEEVLDKILKNDRKRL
mgnify:CR=1 FL=1